MRGAHVDRAVVVEVLRELEARPALRRLEHGFVRDLDLGAALHRDAHHAFPELDRALDVGDVDAVGARICVMPET